MRRVYLFFYRKSYLLRIFISLLKDSLMLCQADRLPRAHVNEVPEVDGLAAFTIGPFFPECFKTYR